MSSPSSRNVSASTTRSRGTSPNSNIENILTTYTPKSNSSTLGVPNQDWQVWNSRPVSPRVDASTPHTNTSSRTESRRPVPETVADDAWQTAPRKPQFESAHYSGPLNPNPGLQIERSPTAPGFSQHARHEDTSARPDVSFLLPRTSTLPPVYPSFPPNGFRSQTFPPPADEFHYGRFLNMPSEDEFRRGVPTQLMHPPMQQPTFLQIPGLCNPYSSRPYGTYYLMSPADLFTDHCFAFEAQSHPGPYQFPVPLNHINIATPPNVIYPYPQPIPPPVQGLTDMRLLPMMPYEYPPRPPPFFFQSPSQMSFSPQSPVHPSHGGLPTNVNMANDFATQSRRKSPLPQAHVSVSPRQPRFSRSQPKQLNNSSHSVTSVSQNGNRRRSHLMGSPSTQSSLMEAFRNSHKDKDWTLRDIFGHIVEFSGDQNGSRLIQQQLEEASKEDKQRVFDEIVPTDADQLIQDVFGNYIIQKFFDVGTLTQKETISLVIETNVIDYSLQIYACRVVQKAFEYMSEDQQGRIINRLEQDLLVCIKDEHGNHVIQKLVDSVSPERLTFLRIIYANVPELAENSNGCRVLQKCLMSLPHAYRQPLLDAIDWHSDGLMRDQYGNYVIQYILQHGQAHEKARMLGRIQGSLVQLAKNQYSSHVCEKAITYSTAETRRQLIDEIMSTGDGEHSISVMMKDDFANYVLQRALAEAEGEQRKVLFHSVRAFLTPLKTSPASYGKQLVRIERLLDIHFGRKDKAFPESDA